MAFACRGMNPFIVKLICPYEKVLIKVFDVFYLSLVYEQHGFGFE
jgi:hypothetical protein